MILERVHCGSGWKVVDKICTNGHKLTRRIRFDIERLLILLTWAAEAVEAQSASKQISAVCEFTLFRLLLSVSHTSIHSIFIFCMKRRFGTICHLN